MSAHDRILQELHGLEEEVAELKQEARLNFHEHYAPHLAKHFIVYSADSGHPLHHKGFMEGHKETPINAAASKNGWNHPDMRWALEKHGQNNNKFAFKNVHTGEYLQHIPSSDKLKMGRHPEHFVLLHAHSHGNYHLFKIVHGGEETRYLTAHRDGGRVTLPHRSQYGRIGKHQLWWFQSAP